jgi:hypothetical protein
MQKEEKAPNLGRTDPKNAKGGSHRPPFGKTGLKKGVPECVSFLRSRALVSGAPLVARGNA